MVKIYLSTKSRYNFSFKELYNYIIVIICFTIAFTICLGGGFFLFVFLWYGIYTIFDFFEILLISFLGTLTGVIIHELCHKLTANFLGYRASFKISYLGIIISILSSFFMVVIAIPGAVIINDKWIGKPLTKKTFGKVAAAGPISNIIIGAVLLLISYLFLPTIILWIWFVAFINVYLGLFNIIIPLGIFDGAYVYKYNKKVWLIIVINALLLFIVTIIFQIIFI